MQGVLDTKIDDFWTCNLTVSQLDIVKKGMKVSI